MGQFLRVYDFQPGKVIYSQQIDDEFNNLIDAANHLDDENDGLKNALSGTNSVFKEHIEKQVSVTSTDSVKDKHVSNKDIKDLYDAITRLTSSVDNVDVKLAKHVSSVQFDYTTSLTSPLGQVYRLGVDDNGRICTEEYDPKKPYSPQYLLSPNGTKWGLYVNNDGALVSYVIEGWY